MENIAVYCAYDELVPVEKLIANPRNYNTHPKAQIQLLAKIIKAQGWRNAIVVSTRSGFIVKGHARLEAASLLGCETCPVDFQEYENEAAEYADMIADNRIAELAEPSLPDLSQLLKELQDTGLDTSLAGYDEKALEKIINDFDPLAPGNLPRLDERKKYKCPECGHEFYP